MLLTVSTTHAPATDLGYLLHKNPANPQSVDLSVGKAHVFYPEATDERCTVALLLDVDPIGLVRGYRGPAGEGRSLKQYVNDRPYVASSFMSVAIAKAFGTAMSGRSKERKELAETAIPLEASISVLPCRGGSGLLDELFGPLGYEVSAERIPFDDHFPEWGESPYHSVRLKSKQTLKDLLSHLYVLIPVLDNDKHYWVTEDECEKLLRHGQSWLNEHPSRDMIAYRYLKKQRHLVRTALDRLSEEEGDTPQEETPSVTETEDTLEKPLSLNMERQNAVVDALTESGAARVLDLGCGEGRLLRRLLRSKQFTEIVGVDVSFNSLEKAKRFLNFDQMPTKQAERITLLHGSLIYRDERFSGYDAAAVVEVIEHLDAPRLKAFERVLFQCAVPKTVVLTTPNIEYNVRFPGLKPGGLRHRDHRFEWTRKEFQNWAEGIAERYGYNVIFQPVGTEDPEVGSPTQMGVFRHED